MNTNLKSVLERALLWPERAQMQLADAALKIETGLEQLYEATAEEHLALEAADLSGLAADEDTREAFRAFRSA